MMRIRGKSNDKTEAQSMLKALVVLAVPTVIEEILSTLLQYVDTAMVGHLGKEATAAVNVTTTITWLVSSVYSAVGIGILAMIAKAIGQKDGALVKTISKQAVLLVVVIGSLTGVVSMALSPFIPRWMGAEEGIWADASAYFFIISCSVLFRAAGSVFGAALRATKDTKTPLYISVLANVINVVLNYLLIYTAALGVKGAAIASAVSYVVFGSVMFAAYRKNKLLHWDLKSFQVDLGQLKECARVSLPVLGTSMASCLGYVIFARLVSDMGTTVFAAHSIAVTAETMFYIAGYGFRTATSTLVGNALGEQDRNKFLRVSKTSVAVTLSMMCVSGVILYFVSYPLMCLLTNSEEVAVLGAEMLRLVAFSEPFFGLMIVAEGIFYGLGRTKYTFFVETFSMWGVRIFMTALVVLKWHMGLRAVWYCMIADNICKAVLLIIPILSGRHLWRDGFTGNR
ncbi:MAG: MATE family efflux transporter [Clostridium sp.]|nr:MATE family efflux transporter [Clostridium sp.]MCM1398702.1 MATE family efflux transporter [Clostridium sp.]MCM1458667.1 MATE family efflux transporter [Bacteroides sp.]